jgi:hypothetical protein
MPTNDGQAPGTVRVENCPQLGADVDPPTYVHSDCDDDSDDSDSEDGDHDVLLQSFTSCTNNFSRLIDFLKYFFTFQRPSINPWWMAKCVLVSMDFAVLRIALGLGLELCAGQSTSFMIYLGFLLWSILIIACKLIFVHRTFEYHRHGLYFVSCRSACGGIALDLLSFAAHIAMLAAFISWAREPEFALHVRATCESAGRVPIADAATCLRAATTLGLAGLTAPDALPDREPGPSWGRPDGCYLLTPGPAAAFIAAAAAAAATAASDGAAAAASEAEAARVHLHHSPPGCEAARRRRLAGQAGSCGGGGGGRPGRACVCECQAPAWPLVTALALLAAPVPVQWALLADALRRTAPLAAAAAAAAAAAVAGRWGPRRPPADPPNHPPADPSLAAPPAAPPPPPLAG